MAHSESAPSAITPLTARDIPDAEALVREAGWNQIAADWRIFLKYGSVHAIRAPGGRVIATAATLPYGGRFGWISMVLVAEASRRRGLATRLLQRCIDQLNAANLVPVLDATPAGREVYRTLGFRDSWGFQRYARADLAVAAPPEPETGFEIHPINDAVWSSLCAYDTAVFGADRSGVLAELRGRAPLLAFYAGRDGRIAGLQLGRDGRIATQIGPLVADNSTIARALLRRGLVAVQGPVFIDVPNSKTEIVAWLRQQGFAVQRPLTRMLQHRGDAFDDGARTFAVVGPEFG